MLCNQIFFLIVSELMTDYKTRTNLHHMKNKTLTEVCHQPTLISRLWGKIIYHYPLIRVFTWQSKLNYIVTMKTSF